MFVSGNTVSAGLSRLTSHRFLAIRISLCDVTSRELSTSQIKRSVWNMFPSSVGVVKRVCQFRF